MHVRLTAALCALCFCCFAWLAAPTAYAAPATQTVPPAPLTLELLGSYTTGVFDEGAAEIVAYHGATQRAFVVNGGSATIDILDLSEPTTPTLLDQIDVSEYGGIANSVAVYGDIVAAAVENDDKQANGSIVFFTPDGEFMAEVEAGALPDMITFTPDGSKVLTANEGEPNADYTVDPEGSVTIVDISGGVATVNQSNVTQVSFAVFNEATLDPAIRIYGPEATVAQDLEPEYIAIAPDSTTAWVTLQENNALAVIDLQASAVITIAALGYKDWHRPQASLQLLEFADLPDLGITAAGQTIKLGGFSGLYFEGINPANGNLTFITHPDRGPNPEPLDVDEDGIAERPFALPAYQAQWVRFEVNPASSQITITERISLTTADGAPISGLPNLAGEGGMAYADEEPVDLFGNALELDPYGADLEGIVRADDGSYWMVDEYRPAIYHFGPDGVLIDRFVPEGSNDNEAGINVGTEAFPAIYAQRRSNRGFEAVAYADGILYAFIQSPIDDPDRGNDVNSRRGGSIRILAFDTTSGTTVGEYIYMIEGGAVDKIGDAVALSSSTMLVVERDAALGADAEKFIFKIDLSNATNVYGMELPQGLQLQSEAGLAMAGIRPVKKELFVDPVALGFQAGDKIEGLALIDENTLAIVNDNDFGITGVFSPTTGLLAENPNPVPSLLGIIALQAVSLDASDRDDAINMQPWPVYGMYQPDAIFAYAVDGETYLVTANEGDARAYDGFSEETRLGDLVLDLTVFPDAATLQAPEKLGRLRTTTVGTDTDGNGLVDRILSYGARSFTIWNSAGELVWDSGSEIEATLAELYPADFNADGENGSFDSRSDDKGAEPEAVELGIIDGVPYAFVGLERIGGVMIYEISNPLAPRYIDYVNNRDFSGDAEAGTAGDIAPEGLKFVPAEQSPTGQPLLLVANEVSGSTSIFAITVKAE